MGFEHLEQLEILRLTLMSEKVFYAKVFCKRIFTTIALPHPDLLPEQPYYANGEYIYIYIYV